MDKRDFIRFLLLLVLLVSVLLACGEKYSGEPAGEESQTPATMTDGVKLISAEKQSDHRWKYVVGLDSKLVKGSKTNPFNMGEHTGWKVESITDANGDGVYEVEISVFNREVALVFGGDNSATSQSKWSWADVTSTSYYSATDDALVIGLCEGKMYKKGQAPFTPPPGEVGDNHLRFKKSGNQLALYLNNNRVNGNVSKPFVMGAWNNWQIIDQTITDSSGWGSVTLSVVSPTTLEFVYGGFYDLSISKSRWSWPTDGSSYYNTLDNRFIACISDNGPVNIGKSLIQASSISSGSCTAVEPIKLVKSEKLDDHRWKYTLAARSDFIIGSKAHPFVIGEHTDWGAVSIADADGDGWYEIIIIVYNREVKFMYGGDNTGPQSQWTWANVSGSKYFSIADSALVVGFKDGQIYVKGEAQFAAPPCETGDAYVRFTQNQDGTLDTCFNNNKANGSVANPWFKGNWTSWLNQPQIITDSSGWGKTSINNFIRPVTFEFVFGGDTVNSSIDLSGATYYNSITHSLQICVQ